MNSILPFISFAALLVKVTVNKECGLLFKACTSQATLWAITLVLPDPAPAKTNRWGDSEVTAFLWASLRLFNILETSTVLFYMVYL